jgi:hypothetical protein
MKTIKSILTAILGLFFLNGLNAQVLTFYTTNTYHGPEKHISRKIKAGIRSGELTRGEVKDLKREYRKIERIKRDAWRNGHLNRHERKRIDRAMFEFDRLLHRYLHNHRDRYDRYDHDQRGKYGYNENWDWYNDEYDYYYKGKRRPRH